MALSPGEMLSDNLELERELGSGGMGAVWLARNTSLGVHVAVKVLKGGDQGPELRARFEREARGLAALDHPNLVRIFDFGLTMDGEPFIVMELLKGEDLARRIARDGPLAPAELAPIVIQTCEALHHAHAQGVVHRDIKPANLFLSRRDGEVVVKVVDFGVAKFAAGDLSQTQTGMMLGTPYYMSPEQFLSPRSIDGRSDLWSLGVVAYVALTGSLPFQGETMTAIGMAASAGRFEPPSRRRAGLPAALDAWMSRALCPQVEQRISSARELSASFLAAIAGASSSTASSASPAAVGHGATVVMRAPAPPASAQAEGPGAAAASAQPSPLAVSVAASAAAATPAPEPRAAAAPPAAAAPAPARGRGAWLGAAAVAAIVVGAGAFALTRERAQPGSSASDDPAASAARQPSAVASASVSPTLSAPASALPAPSASAAPSAVASAPPPSASAPLPSAAPAPSAAPSLAHAPSAAPPVAPSAPASAPVVAGKRDPSKAIAATRKCWAGNEGAIPGTAATQATVSLPISATGKAGSPVIGIASGEKHPAFRGCVVSQVTSLQYGEGSAETMAFSVSLPAAK